MSIHAFTPTFKPFSFVSPEIHEVEDMAFEAGEPSYALVQSGPAVSPEEVESAHLDAIEVKASWGHQILSVSHLEPGTAFAIGEGTDLAVPSIVGRHALVENGYLHVPANAVASLGAESWQGPQSIALPSEGRIVVVMGDFTFEVATVRKGRVAKASLLASLAGGATGFVGLSFLAHAAIVASMAMFMPKMGPDDAEALDRQHMMDMRAMIDAAAEREKEQTKQDNEVASTDSQGGGQQGALQKGEAGAAGQDKPVTKPGHMTIKGDAHSMSMAKSDIEAAREFGMIELLGNNPVVGLNGPSNPWGTTLTGSDSTTTAGDLWSNDIGDAFGTGVGLSGNGLGGGGKGDVIGVGPGGLGGLGHCLTGNCPPGVGGVDGAGPGGMGHGGRLLGGVHNPKPPVVRDVVSTVNGQIPRDVIQRIVRLNFGRFRLCYENGLRSNPSLTGVVKTKFVIDRNGAVSQSMDGGSDMPDQAVVSCVVRSFGNLSFPTANGQGITTVIYPVAFSPGE